MKNYPYVHSLSTIGLIHHYNNDYLFNRTRTDFTGDSGTGKSMIADLLQLIFVGSSEFEAATESIDEKRRPKGMVLSDKKRGLSGKGYAFINIAIEKEEFLIIGMYLEHSTNYARPFIVHKGYDLENPDHLGSPVLHETFLKEDSILPIEDLKEHLKGIELNCETLQLSAYHRFLFNQEILPINLVDDSQKLKTFALIIRSFSRGKGFKFDTKNLQDFLFGIDKEKEILTNYNHQIDNIKSSLQDSLDYQKQIEELKRKQSAIQNLITLDEKRVESRNTYLNTNYSFLNSSQFYFYNQHKKVTAQLSKSVLEMTILKKLDNQQQTKIIQEEIDLVENFVSKKESRDSLQKKEQEAQELYFKKKEIQRLIHFIDELLPQCGNSIEEVKDYYSLQKENLKKKDQLQSFRNELRRKKILDAFDQSEWHHNYEKALADYKDLDRELDEQVKTNKALLKFSKVDDKTSIAHWAIHREKGFSRIEESVLIKFKELIVSDPENFEKEYLPKPEVLFEKIKQDFSDDKGFWITLSGIYKYVPFVENQFLEGNDPSIKKNYFNNKYKKAEQAVKLAEIEKEKQKHFHSQLHSISGLLENITLYANKNEIESFKTIDNLTVDKITFEDTIKQYDQKEVFLDEFQKAKEDWEDANNKLKKLQELDKKYSNINVLSNQLMEVKTKYEKLKADGDFLERKLNCIRSFLYDTTSLKKVESELEEEINQTSLASIIGNKKQQETELRSDRLKLKRRLGKTNNELDQLSFQFEEIGLRTPEIDPNIGFSADKIEDLRIEFENNTRDYIIAIQSLVNDFLAHDHYKYQNEDDWRKLAKGLLPEVFKSIEITEDIFSKEIEERLQGIVDKDKVISDRKVQLLSDVFGKVEEAFSSFSNEIDRLRVFFNGNDKRITGGHRISIKLDRSLDYPINWISEFKKQMREKNANRFGGLFNDQDEILDFKEIIKKSFKQCGGKKIDPKIEDLLNPKKYFELSFSLQKDSIKTGGSTGQVYSAIALLCIARISLIEQVEGTKKRKGIRFMPVDEAEGLGSNYEMLSNIARNEDYQIVSMSINPVGEFEEGSHYIYMLNEPEDEEVRINGVPFAQFTEDGVSENIHQYIVERYDG